MDEKSISNTHIDLELLLGSLWIYFYLAVIKEKNLINDVTRLELEIWEWSGGGGGGGKSSLPPILLPMCMPAYSSYKPYIVVYTKYYYQANT